MAFSARLQQRQARVDRECGGSVNEVLPERSISQNPEEVAAADRRSSSTSGVTSLPAEQAKAPHDPASVAEQQQQRTPSAAHAEAFSWMKHRNQGMASRQGATPKRPVATHLAQQSPSQPSDTDVIRHPDLETCQLAINSMIQRNSPDMKEGLERLDVQVLALRFIPGVELRLCGHNVRELVNQMIVSWMNNSVDRFYILLAELREKADHPILTQQDMDEVHLDPKDWEQFEDGEEGLRWRPKDRLRALIDADPDAEVIDVHPPRR
mmetsp:Transcript_6583/g.11447  ORF Transcript_6583/g.11447 Transcript_6583/m.11447 type:complete len:266 (-) Transcript_6583:36-833(-)